MEELVVAVSSDLHVEFHADGGRALAEAMNPEGVDVLVLAGDIAVGVDISDALGVFCRRFARSDVVYVHGNHEHYFARREDVARATKSALDENANLHVLDGTMETIRGRRFLGGTMWFRDGGEPPRVRARMNDFLVIPDFVPWVHDECARTIAFLDGTLCAGDIVVTHHLPSLACVPERFRGSPLNAFFVCDVEALVVERKPALWVHGHTHDSVDVAIGETRVVCNPFGYAQSETNASFDASFRVRA
jgi:predicted phosphodiesterase